MANNGLSRGFKKYIETTHNVCIYKLGSGYMPSNIFFPNAKTLTLINCYKNGISNILSRDKFPNIDKINYMSVRPNDEMIYKRFPGSVEWIFPDKNYDFYNAMVERGVGKKRETLIKEFVASKKVIDGKNGFDISFQFDLNIPEYGIINGEWWRLQFHEYILSKQKESIESRGQKIPVLTQEVEECHLQRERVKFELDTMYFEEDD